MIIFNNAGHCFLSKIIYEEPIVWVDAQDISTYTLGSASGFGNELITNGDFSDDLNDWSSAVGWSVTNGVAFCDGTQSGFTRLEQTVLDIPNNGKTYIITVEGVSITQGQLSIGTSGGGFRTLNVNDSGTFTHIFNNTLDSEVGVVGFVDFIGSVSNISVKEVLAYDVTNLDNKGVLGGAMTLNGSVKFANGGFESWSNSDYITRDLGEPFMNDNSFTIVTTFDYQDNASAGALQWFSSLSVPNNSINRVETLRESADIELFSKDDNVDNKLSSSYVFGVQTIIGSYDLDSQTFTALLFNGNSQIYNSISYTTTLDCSVSLLKSIQFNYFSGQNNPLHEFRLYNRAMSLVEMQDLQTELNNKYIILGDELVVNGDFSDGLNGWTSLGDGEKIIENEACKLLNGNGEFDNRIRQGGYIEQNKTYKVSYEILENNNCNDFRAIINQNAYDPIPNSVGYHEFYFTRTSDFDGSIYIYFKNSTDDSDITIDNISVKEILN